MTYRAWADGRFVDYFQGLLITLGLAVGGWCLVRVQLAPGAVLPWITAVAVLVPGDVAHYARLARGPGASIERSVSDTFAAAAPTGGLAEDRWSVEVKSGASVQVLDGQLVIVDPTGVVGYVDLRLPEAPRPDEYGVLVPLGLYRGAYVEEVSWTVQVERERDYLMLLTTRGFTLEVTRFGLHLLYVGLDRKNAERNFDTPLANDGQPHRYRVERTRRQLRFSLDGKELTALGANQPWDFVRFGETRADQLHGGTLTLDDVHYVRRYYAD